MIKKVYFLILSCVIVLNYSSIFGSKFVVYGSPASNCIRAMERYMKQSGFFSDDLKKAFLERPEKMIELGQSVLTLMFFASERPTVEVTDHTESRLFNGTATVKDLVSAFKIMSSYGQAAYINETFSKLPHEPTTDPRPVLHISPFLVDRPFKSALDEINTIISIVGNDLKWPKEKIEEEQKAFVGKLEAFFNESQKQTT